jgi:hypothetical protein
LRERCVLRDRRERLEVRRAGEGREIWRRGGSLVGSLERLILEVEESDIGGREVLRAEREVS